MTDIFLFERLGTRSRRALLKTKGRFGADYFYNPRGDLLVRLAKETGLSIDEVYDQLQREREFLLSQTEQPS